jgi:hypothetical protein
VSGRGRLRARRRGQPAATSSARRRWTLCCARASQRRRAPARHPAQYPPPRPRTWGAPTSHSTLNSRRRRSTMISRCSSPMPSITVWPVSSSREKPKEGSSCASLARPMPWGRRGWARRQGGTASQRGRVARESRRRRAGLLSSRGPWARPAAAALRSTANRPPFHTLPTPPPPQAPPTCPPHHLLQVALGLGLDRDLDHGVGEVHALQHDGGLLVAQRLAGDDVLWGGWGWGGVGGGAGEPGEAGAGRGGGGPAPAANSSGSWGQPAFASGGACATEAPRRPARRGRGGAP